MRKIFIAIFASVMCINTVQAEQLVLSDIIQQAREAQIKQEAKQKAELAMMQPVTVKNNQNPDKDACGQNAAERIKPQELTE